MLWEKIGFAVIAVIFIWLLFRFVKGTPRAFSASNMSKSVTTLGFLALLLIGFIAIMIAYLKHAH
jgi:cytochrome b561